MRVITKGTRHWNRREPLAPLPTVPDACPHCTAKQWIQDSLAYTCLTCGFEILTASDPTLLTFHPEDRDPGLRRIGGPRARVGPRYGRA